ncbi:pseudouridine synthase [Paracoccus sp. Arc7-R13]|uniref:pseudouridine synthase n=2 Tax=Paracoccus TaxID=265 RepID=UPI000FDBCD7A|nr:pseudouridine synthase [Paracoccus sp. Arc7-R13]AZY94788.1 pseudouridine synthase [Paracoccus sp. Arc7-R13]
MTDDQIPDRKAPQVGPRTEADRIAKVMARAGVASRREAERMIIEGRVSVNGKKIDSPALDVLPTDRITVDGKKLEEPQETRLWLYYKPLGLITSENDELGRQTVFDALPRDMPRVMTVGRLDLNSEGLLLLTNDGELKRRLELPATGWLRRYRVRVNGTPSDMTFDPLRRGVTIEGEDFAPMEIKLDSQQGANAWISVGIREGKNREIRRAMAHVGLQVNRLIRIGYGPFKLTGMDKNQVTEVKRKVLRDQLGGLLTGEVEDKPREMRPRGAAGERAARSDGGDAGPRRFGPKPGFDGKPAGRGFGDRPRDGQSDRPARSWGAKPAGTDGARPRFGARDDSAGGFGDRPRPAGDKPRWKKSGPGEGGGRTSGQGDDARPARFAGKPGEARKPYGAPRGEGGEGRKPFGGPRPEGKPFGKPRADGDRKPYGAPRGEGGEGRKPFGSPRPEGKPFGKPRADGDRKPYGAPRGEGAEGRKPFGGPRPEAKPFGKPRADGDRKPYGAPRGEGAEGRKPFGGPRGDAGGKFQGKPRPGGAKPFGAPRGDRPQGGGRPGGKPRG